MKLLYILVSQLSDYYYEQALLSIMSAKYRMPQIHVALMVDDGTEKTLVGSRKDILNFVDEFRVVKCDAQQSPMIRSRFLKTMMREYIDGDFLYVDVDTLWVNSIDEKDFDTDIMSVPDAHVELSNHPSYNYIMSEHSKLGFDLKGSFYLNGGVLYLKDSDIAHEFMKEWNKYWRYSCEKGTPTDQKSLNYVASEKKYSVRFLPDSYNVQISYTIKYLLYAKLLHYFGSAKIQDESKLFFELQKRSFWEKFRELNQSFDLVQDVIKHPEEYFASSMVQLHAENEHVKHPSYELLCDIIKSEKKVAKNILGLFNVLARVISKIYKVGN